MNNIETHLAVLDFFGFSPVIGILSQKRDYDDFCDQNDIPTEDRHHGFRILLESITRSHLNEIDNNRVLRLESSRLYERCSVSSVDRSKRPRDTSLGMLAYDLHRRFRKLREKTASQEYEKLYEHELKDYVDGLDRIFDTHVELRDDLKKSLDKRKALRLASVRWCLENVYNPDTNLAVAPYLGPLSVPGREYRFFHQFKAALAYLYERLYEPEFHGGFTARLLQARSGQDLKLIALDLRQNDVAKMEQLLGVDIPAFILKQPVDWSPLDHFIVPSEDSRVLTIHEKRDEFFLYYPFELVEALGKVFSGFTAFMRLLHGEIWLRKTHYHLEPVEIVRIRHAREGASGNDFTYAILVSSGMSYYDASGWIVFVNCCSDYPLRSLPGCTTIETNLEESEQYLKVSDIDLAVNELRDHILLHTQTRGIRPSRVEILEHLHRQTVETTHATAGILLELIAYLLESTEKPYLKWGFEHEKLGDCEIDLVAGDMKESWIIECTHHLSADNHEETKCIINEFQKKAEALLKIPEYRGSTVHKVLVTRYSHLLNMSMSSTIQTLTENGIELKSIEELLDSSHYSDRAKDRITRILRELDYVRLSDRTL